MTCPSFETLAALGRGALDDDERTTIERHVGACAACAASAVTLSLGPPAPRMSDVAPGTTIGRFTVLGKLGEGGMGIVLGAYDPQLDRKVAVKILRGAATATSMASARLVREAKAMARLSHRNVVAIYDVGTVGEQTFIAMEHVDGETLAAWLGRTRRSWLDIVTQFVHAGRGLAAAHDVGLVHRDFKPQNVLVSRGGEVRVTDFGLVGASASASPEAAAAGSPEHLTLAGAVVGTLLYMSPEQQRGEAVDARADQFSYCVALYEAVFGVRPFSSASGPGRLEAIEGARLAAPVTDAPRWLRAILARGLLPRAADRWPSMTALLDALARDPARRRRKLAMLLGLVALAAAIAFTVSPKTAATPCRGAAGQLAGVWDEPARRRLGDALRGTGRADAGDAARILTEALDRYAGAWVAMRTDACEATFVRQEQSGQLLDLRMACLDARRVELDALARVFSAHPSPKALENAAGAAADLIPIASCADREALASAVPPPADPGRRARADTLRAQVLTAKQLAAVGQLATGLALAAPTVDAVRAVDHPPLLAEALAVRGHIETQLGLRKAAEASVRAAIAEAARGKADRQVADGWLQLVVLLRRDRERLDDAMALEPVAQAALMRVGDDAVLQATYDWAFGMVLRDQSKLDEAEVRLAAALARLPASDVSRRADMLMTYGNLLVRKDRPADGVKALEETVALYEKAAGPGSYRASISQYNLARAYWKAERCDDARKAGERALALAERILGADNPDLVLDLMTMGELESDCLKDEAAARRYFGRSIALAEKATPGSLRLAQVESSFAHSLITFRHHAEAEALLLRAEPIFTAKKDAFLGARNAYFIGYARLEQGALAGATTAMTRAVELYEGLKNESDLALALVGLGDIAVRGGHPGDAIAPLERALPIEEKAGQVDLPKAQFLLAQALWASGGDRARADRLAQAAEERFAAQKRDELRAEIASWRAGRAR
jgi:tetratricopeptide (TPR) repeat protein